MRLLAILLLTACQPHTFDTVGDAVGYCMVLGEVPVRAVGRTYRYHSAPDGWFMCDGALLGRVEYAA